MKKLGLIAIGIAIGIIAEIGSLWSSFSGVNVFHGGHPNVIVNALLPGLGIVEHLSGNGRSPITASLLVISLVQFPIYGALCGRDYANKAISKTTIGAIVLHLIGAAIAFYGVMLERQWQNATVEWGICRRVNDTKEHLSATSDQILRHRRWVEQTKSQLQKLRTEREQGIVYTPDPEEGLIRNLASEQEDLVSLWETYKKAGGEAKSIDDVHVVSPPCGKAPPKPTLFD